MATVGNYKDCYKCEMRCDRDFECYKENQSIKIFGYRICQSGINKIWMENKDGEGMELSQERQKEIRELLNKWWEEIF